MPPADRSSPPTPAPASTPDVGTAPGPLPPGHPQAAELERLRLLYERGALAGADYWAVRAYILEQAVRAGVGAGEGGGGAARPGLAPLTPRDRLLGGGLWAAGFMLVLLAAGGVWKAGELLVGRAGAGPGAAPLAAEAPGDGGPGGGFGPGDGGRGWSLAAGADWLLGRPPRPPEGFGPPGHAPFLARAGAGFGSRFGSGFGDRFGGGFGDGGDRPWRGGPPDGFGRGSRHGFGPPGPPPDGFGGDFGPPGPPPDE